MGYAALQIERQSVSEVLLDDIEALAEQESGSTENLNCYCVLLSDQSCAVNNNGSSKCATGPNVKCWEYNNNCN